MWRFVMASVFPTIGNWYQDVITQQLMEVVAVDEDSGTIEVQYEDGDIDEYDIESWSQLSLSSAAAPEDANAGYEASYEDPWDNDFGYSSSFNSPLEIIEPDSFSGYDDLL